MKRFKNGIQNNTCLPLKRLKNYKLRHFIILITCIVTLFQITVKADFAFADSSPSLYSPSSSEEFYKGIDITFDWSDVSGASYYDIWIDNNSGFGSPEIGFNNGASSNYVTDGICSSSKFVLRAYMQNYLPQNYYYWKVRALNSRKEAISTFTGYRSFVLLDPTNPDLSLSKTNLKVGDSIKLTCSMGSAGKNRPVAFLVDIGKEGKITSYGATTNSSGNAYKYLTMGNDWAPSTSFKCRDEKSSKTSSWKTAYIEIPKGSISGGVRNKYGDDPIRDAYVQLKGANNYSVYSQWNGVYEFNNVVPGSYQLVTSKSGYETSTKSKYIGAGQNLTFQNVILYPNSPNISSFKINNGNSKTQSRTVTLNSSVSNRTHYIASQNSNFSGASWNSYSSSPSFTLSKGFGNKTVYFKVKNNGRESSSKSDTILYIPSPTISKNKSSMKVGEKVALSCDLSSEGANRRVTFYVANSKVIETKAIYANSSGKASLDLTAKDNWGSYVSFACQDYDTEEFSQYSSKVPIKDNSSPNLNISLKENELVHGWKAVVTISSNEPDDDNYSCEWNVEPANKGWISSIKTGSFDIIPDYFVIGNNTIKVRCSDSLGAQSSKSQSIIDYEKPDKAPDKLSPNNGNEQDINDSYEFKFGGLPDPIPGQKYHYIAMIDDNDDFSSPVVNNLWLAGCPFYIGNDKLKPGKTYYWKVRARNELNYAGPWSNVESFKIKPQTGVINISDATYPQNGVPVGERYNISYTLKEISGAPVEFSDILCEVYDKQSNLLFNLENHEKNIKIQANGTWVYNGTGFAVGKIEKPDTYSYVLKGKIDNWFTIASTDNSKNPIIIKVIVDPQISISSDSVAQGENYIISGSKFNTFDNVSLSINGPKGYENPFDVSTDNNGKFSYNWLCPENIPSGYFSCNAIDNTSSQKSNSIDFIVYINGTPPENGSMGVLAREIGIENPEVYWIKYNKKFHIKTQEIFDNLGYSLDEIRWYNKGALNNFDDANNILENNTNFLYRNQSKSTVYIIRNGNSDYFFNWSAFENSDFSGDNIYWCTDKGFDWIQSQFPQGQLIGDYPKIRIEPDVISFK